MRFDGQKQDSREALVSVVELSVSFWPKILTKTLLATLFIVWGVIFTLIRHRNLVTVVRFGLDCFF
jgi:hypothetical protein